MKITQLMSVGASTEAVFAPARWGYISQSLQETHGTLKLGYWGKVLKRDYTQRHGQDLRKPTKETTVPLG